ncbi:M28 family peptidase [Aureibaculum sp. 2210JD6-5]|uniref:M28 family peptidase n=1 Tax=Aureibaculum sp. 2210JD6-5 TaxID=3103957 RepID=UPI002AAE65DA|nr:M28 family peptidase [Aureibaculum sp. 2210JD6-5]MDY7393822.1 M28 family peptidase [Aureibaculum sp. 2210JD6-5]
MKALLPIMVLLISTLSSAQSDISKLLTEIATAPSAERIEKDIRTLVNFGTRHTLSDTVSKTRGIGAARRWIKSEFDNISKDCNNCLEVSYQRNLVPKNDRRIVKDVEIVNVLAIQRGTKYPNSYVIMSGDIDSRVSDANNFTSDSPGANDNASGMAGTIEAARILTNNKFPVSIIYAGLSGEEQGLYGGQHMAKIAKDEGWNIIGVINNDMIGNIKGIDGVVDNSTFRVFSEAISMETTDRERAAMRYYGGEVDGPSRQLARYIDKITDDYMTNLDAIMIYRLDRFGRGGHHRPFNDAGFTGVRIMETHENYNEQHQDLRTENGIKYGDVIESVNFDYAAKLTAVNALTLASLASAPLAPENLKIGGAVQPSTQLQWDAVEDDNLLGYKVYWRDTTSPQWQHSRFVGKLTDYTLKNIVIDNYLFGVASVGKNGAESLVQFPNKLIGRD